MSMSDVVAGVRAAIEVFGRRHRDLLHAVEQTDRSRTMLAAVTSGTVHPGPREALDCLGRSRDELNEAVVRTADAKAKLEAYLAGLEGVGQSVSRGAVTSAPRVSAPATPSGPPRLADFRPGQIHPDAVRDLKERVGFPRNSEGRTSARGTLYDVAGNPVNAKPFEPYRKGDQPYRPELVPAFNDPEHTTTAWHAEADAAQAIRDGNMAQSTLYLNVPLCGKKVPDSQYPHPHKCYANFRHTIPAGITTYVVVVPERGTPYKLKVFGTGEGLDHDG